MKHFSHETVQLEMQYRLEMRIPVGEEPVPVLVSHMSTRTKCR
jgi:hypothetical protein